MKKAFNPTALNTKLFSIFGRLVNSEKIGSLALSKSLESVVAKVGDHLVASFKQAGIKIDCCDKHPFDSAVYSEFVCIANNVVVLFAVEITPYCVSIKCEVGVRSTVLQHTDKKPNLNVLIDALAAFNKRIASNSALCPQKAETTPVANPKRVVVIQSCKFGKGDVREVKFVATKKQVVVTCKGLPNIVVTPYPTPGRKSHKYQAKVEDPNFFKRYGKVYERLFFGATPKQAYSRAVSAAWLK